jgi:hypothetical protein
MTTDSLEDNHQCHYRLSRRKMLAAGFTEQWVKDPETRFTIELVSGETYARSKLIDVSEPRLLGESGMPIGPAWLELEFDGGVSTSVSVAAIASVTWDQ